MQDASAIFWRASGVDVLTHGLEAYASMMATDYTDGLALKSMKNVFDYLPRAYEYGAADPEARQKMACLLYTSDAADE